MDDQALKKKYSVMENVLNKINQKYIALSDEEVKRNNKILEQVTDTLTAKMKEKNPMFKAMFERKFFGGSFYDSLKVGKPEEYDIDYVLNIPVLAGGNLEISNKPGFVNVKIDTYSKLAEQPKQLAKFEKLKSLLDDKMYLSTDGVLRWMEATISLALNDIGKDTEGRTKFLIDISTDEKKTEKAMIFATVSKSHPAFTLKLKSEDGGITLDIDIVPCFQFTNDDWPKGKYRKNPFPVKRNKFLVVPKKPYVMDKSEAIHRYWRLSFQEQERDIITGPHLNTLKPALKLIKKLRDKHNHKISSYFVKTVFLWEAEENYEKWCQPLSSVFMMMLRKYADMVQDHCIPYYWNKNFNLIAHIKDVTLNDIGNTLKNIIETIDNHVYENPFIAGMYFVDQGELERLKTEVDLGRKTLKKISSTGLLSPSQSSTSLTPCNDKHGLIDIDQFRLMLGNHMVKINENDTGDVSSTTMLENSGEDKKFDKYGNNDSTMSKILNTLEIMDHKTDKICATFNKLEESNRMLLQQCLSLTATVQLLKQQVEVLSKNVKEKPDTCDDFLFVHKTVLVFDDEMPELN